MGDDVLVSFTALTLTWVEPTMLLRWNRRTGALEQKFRVHSMVDGKTEIIDEWRSIPQSDD